MTERYDVKVPRVGKDGKTYSTKIGVMFPWKSGKDGFNIIFEALPIPKMGQSGEIEVMCMAAPPFEEDKERGN